MRPSGHDLQPLAFQIVDVEAELLVRADHDAARRIALVDPDRRIVGRIAVAVGGLGFHARLDCARRLARFSWRQLLAGFGKRQRLRDVVPRDELVVAGVLVGDDQRAVGKPSPSAAS